MKKRKRNERMVRKRTEEWLIGKCCGFSLPWPKLHWLHLSGARECLLRVLIKRSVEVHWFRLPTFNLVRERLGRLTPPVINEKKKIVHVKCQRQLRPIGCFSSMIKLVYWSWAPDSWFVTLNYIFMVRNFLIFFLIFRRS